MQQQFPFMHEKSAVVYYCLNAECFYCESVIGVYDAVPKHVWNSELGMLDVVLHCPSCDSELWGERDGSE